MIAINPIRTEEGVESIPPYGYPYEKVCLHPLSALLRHPVQKYSYNFCFNQKTLFFKPQLKYFLDILKTIFRFFGPPGKNIQKLSFWC